MDSFTKDNRVITHCFLMSVSGGNTSAQRSHHSRFFISPAAPAISLSPRTYQAQGTLKRQFHRSGQGGWLGGCVRRSAQSSPLGDTSLVLFSLELPWGGKLGLQPFPHRGLQEPRSWLQNPKAIIIHITKENGLWSNFRAFLCTPLLPYTNNPQPYPWCLKSQSFCLVWMLQCF